MTFKEILKDWWKSLKDFSTNEWKAIRNLFSTSFHLLKDPFIVFVKDFWIWLKAIFKGLYEIVKAFLIDFVKATVKMIYNSVICFYNWLVLKLKRNK